MFGKETGKGRQKSWKGIHWGEEIEEVGWNCTGGNGSSKSTLMTDV